MTLTRTVKYDLHDARATHGHIYDLEVYDGDEWVPHGQLAVLNDAITHDGTHVHTIDYHGANHTVLLRGKADDAAYLARLDFTACGTAFVGTISENGQDAQPVRGVEYEQIYDTRRHLKSDPYAPFQPWETFTIRSAWVDKELVITYLLGKEDISSRVRVVKVDRQKGETTLEMVPQFDPPFKANGFEIVLVSGTRSFTGVYTDEDRNDYVWAGQTEAKLAASRAAVFSAAHESRDVLAKAAAPVTTMSFQDLDNISSIQVLLGPDNKPYTVDYAQTTTGSFFNKCLTNALDKKWLDGIFGHGYSVPAGVQKVADTNSAFFKDKSVLSTGQMLYDTLSTSPTYKDLMKRVNATAMETAWKDMGKSDTLGVTYQTVSNDLYIQGYREGVKQMQPYLEDNPEKWAEGYYGWLTSTNNLLTWQIQVASKEFDNVKTRMYEWYVKLQVLAPDKDYGKRFMTIAYSALLGVNYSKAGWDNDLKPFLQALIENALSGKVDPAVMDQLQQQAAKENQELLKQLITTTDQIIDLVDGIAAALTAYQLKKSLQQLAGDPEAQRLIQQQLTGPQYEAWSQLTAKGKIGGILSMLFYGASAGFLLYTLAEDTKNPQTPKRVLEEINLGMLSLALLVKGVERLMSLGVGKFVEAWAARSDSAFATFAGEFALWFKEGGKVVPVGKAGKAFVAIFGENVSEFMARRMGPALAVVGLVLTSFQLYEAIKSGNVRNIIFESLNTFFALASVVLIGLELLSVAWAGPVGLAVAAIGIIVVLIQFIWNLFDPPKPPPDPITEFVNGPMVAQGFATT